MYALQLENTIAMMVRRVTGHIRSRAALSDSELVLETQKGSHDAFGEIVRRYQNFIFRQAWGYLQDDDAAKDIAQDVFLKAYEGISRLRAAPTLRTWLYRICRNRCLNVLRKKKTERELSPEPKSRPAPDVALRVYLKDLIGRLDDPYREVVMLRYYGDLTYDEIAEVLDISTDNVKVRLFRAKRMLKSMMGGSTDGL